LFTLGSVSRLMSDRLSSCIKNGHALALHGYSHQPPMAMTEEQFRRDLVAARTQMQELFQVDVKGFRAPCFSLDKARLDILKELGFRYDSSYLNFLLARHTVKLDLSGSQKLRDYMFRMGDFYEFGIPTGKFLGLPFPICGGGYVRLDHFWFVKTMIRRHIRKNDYYTFYLHPFELTRKKIPFIKELKSYDKYYVKHGIRAFPRRIESIIHLLKKHGFEFVTYEQLLDIMEKEGN